MSLVDLGKRLLEAAKHGHTDEVRTLMSNGAPFTTDWLGTSPLHFAAQHGHVGTAEVLLRAGISRDARTKVDRTPLHVASQEGYPDVVDLLIKNGADIEAKDMLKMTPLHWAVEKGHVGVIELLLGHGADINIDNKFDKNPVEIAINNGRADLAELLQLARMPQQNVVEVTTDPTVVEEVTATTSIENHEGLEHVEDVTETVVKGGTVNLGLSSVDEVTESGTEQSSTAVLATLAALAEATGPLNSANTTNATAAEALNWLESHGITMISGDNPTTLVESGGQSLSLTEAGKLALDFVKQHKVINVGGDEQLTDEDGNPMVIRLTTAEEAEAVTEVDEPVLKKIKLEDSEGIPEGAVLTKSEPPEDFTETVEESIIEPVTTESITEEGVAMDGGMIIMEGGVIVSQEAIAVQEELEGITVQSDMISQAEEVSGDMAAYTTTEISTEEIQDFEAHQHEAEGEVIPVSEINTETVEVTNDEEQLNITDQLDEITSKT